jgi:hypothetical protein
VVRDEGGHYSYEAARASVDRQRTAELIPLDLTGFEHSAIPFGLELAVLF